MENVRQMLNRPEVRNLNCIRDVKFPVNYSLQAVEMKPTEEDPGLVSLTIRIPGEVRVVHGSEDVFGAVKEAVKKHINAAEEAESEGLTIQEKQGAWVIQLEKGIFSKRQGVELLCQIMENVTKAGYDMLTSSRFSTTPGFELRTWILKKAATPIENPQVMALAFPAADKVCVVGAKEDNPANPVVQAAIEKVMKPSETGPKDIEEPDVKVTEPEKKEETKEEETKEEEEKEKEVAEEKKDEDKKENDNEEDKKEVELDNKDEKSNDDIEPPVKAEEVANQTKKPQDDNDAKADTEKESSDEKVNEFKLDMNQLNAENGKILRSKLLLEVLHQLFCRQWKLICSSHVPFGGDHEVMFFIQDTRILPGLGQDHFAMLEIEKPDMVRLYGLNEDMEGKIKTVMQEHWMPGLDSKDPEEVHEVKSYKLLEEPWNQSCVIKDGSGPMPRLVVSPQILVAKFLLAMNKAEMNVYESITLDVGKTDQKTLVIFRQSNVGYTQELTLKLAGVNRIGVLGGTEADIEAIRKCLQSRWPYPLTHDYKVEKEGNEEEFWQFKVKRYPWAVSYGNKHIDRAIETAQSLIQQHHEITFPPPQNMDAESGKSILVYLIKELSDLGWRVQFCGDISSQNVVQKRPPIPERPSDPVSLYFLK